MANDLKNRLKTVLDIEKELSFVPPGTAARKAKVDKRDAELRRMVDAYPFVDGVLPQEDAKLLGMALLFLREAQEEDGRILPPAPNKVLCQGLSKQEESIREAYHCKAIKLWGNVLNAVEKRQDLKHKEKTYCLDRVIKRLRGLESGIGNPESLQKVRSELARALFLRAKIIRRKGFTVPLKKKEKLAEALNVLPPEKEPNLQRLRAWIHYEMARLEEDGDWFKGMTDEGWEALEETVRKIDLRRNPADAPLLLAAAERDPKSWKRELKALVDVKGNPLDQAWAAWLLENDNKAFKYAKKAASLMPPAFSHEGWERLVRLVRQMEAKTAMPSDWPAVALRAWESCRKRERRTNHLHLRWYWSRQRELYDLAFRAAESPQKKARIADSLKSRPALTLSQLQGRINTDEELEKLYEEEASGYLDQYITNFSVDHSSEPFEDIPWKDLPFPWIAVHFYLEDRKGEEEGKETGHALIYNSENSDKDKWVEKTFNQIPLWQAFWAWQEAYRLHGDKADNSENELEKCALPLERLCLALGKEMEFLFEESLFPPDRPVLFVTHDFLHRLPIHMAMKENEKKERLVWAETHRSAYLPAFWIWLKQNQDEELKAGPAHNPPVALINLSQGDRTLTGKVAETVTSQGGQVHDPAPDAQLLGISKPPSFLVILCHGQAHPSDPFSSSLLDADLKTWVTVQGILAGGLNIAGSKVVLAACEADLAPPLSSSIDEHLSVSTALLQRDAVELLGSLWRVGQGQADALALMMLREKNKSMLDALARWQREQIEGYVYRNNRIEKLRALYKCAPFRLLSVSSVKIGENDDGK